MTENEIQRLKDFHEGKGTIGTLFQFSRDDPWYIGILGVVFNMIAMPIVVLTGLLIYIVVPATIAFGFFYGVFSLIQTLLFGVG